MAVTVDKVIVDLEARIGQYERRLHDAERLFSRTTGNISAQAKGMSTRMATGFSLAGLAVGGFVAVLAAQLPAALFKAVKAGLDYAASLKTISQEVGVTTTELQEYFYIAGQTNMKTSEMENVLRRATAGLGKLTEGVKGPVMAMKELGFSAKETAEIAGMTAANALPKLADALLKIESPARRAYLGAAIFGETFQQLEPILAQGSAGMNRLRDAAHELGVVLTEEQISKADETANKLDSLMFVLKTNIAGAVANNSGAILDMADAVAHLASEMLAAIPKIQNFYHQVAGAIAGAQAETARFVSNTVNHPLNRFNPLTMPLRNPTAERNRQATIRDAERRQTDHANAYLRNRFDMARSVSTRSRSPRPRSSTNPQGLDAINKTLAGRPARAARGSGAGRDNSDQLRREAERAAREAAEKLRQYTDALARLNGEMLTINAEILNTDAARLEAKLQNIEIERQIDVRRIEAEEKMDGARKAEWIAKTNSAAAARTRQITEEAAREQADKELSARTAWHNAEAQNEADLIRAQLPFVKSRGERAVLEQRLVELAFEQERLALQEITHSTTATDAQKAIAEARLRILEGLKEQSIRAAKEENKSPGGKYLDELNKTPEELNDDFQQVAVDGLQQFNDGIVDAIMGTKSLKDAFKDMANAVIRNLLRIIVQQLIVKTIAEALFGAGAMSGGGGGGFFGKIFGTGKASGGNVQAGKVYPVGERGMELFQAPQSGKIIPNGQLRPAGMGMEQAKVTIEIVRGELFEARVAKIAGPVAAEIVDFKTPGITEMAAMKTHSLMNRPHM